MKKGKFIALYGINGIGKSTQIDLIVAELKKRGVAVKYLKYPVYDLEPEGPFLNKYLRDDDFRKSNPQTTHELQEKFAKNRLRYQEALEIDLKDGYWVIAEDYVGTGIVWGMTWGGSYTYLKEINKDLLKPDIEILLDGDQFGSAIEKGHRNEENEERIKICRNFLLMSAKIENWEVVNANQKIQDVTSGLLKKIAI